MKYYLINLLLIALLSSPLFAAKHAKNSREINKLEISKKERFCKIRWKNNVPKIAQCLSPNKLYINSKKMAPQLITPKNKEKLVPDETKSMVSFTWNAKIQSRSYLFEIANDPYFNNIYFQKRVNARHFESAQFAKGTFFWRVSSIDKSGKVIETSSIYEFQTLDSYIEYKQYLDKMAKMEVDKVEELEEPEFKKYLLVSGRREPIFVEHQVREGVQLERRGIASVPKPQGASVSYIRILPSFQMIHSTAPSDDLKLDTSAGYAGFFDFRFRIFDLIHLSGSYQQQVLTYPQGSTVYQLPFEAKAYPGFSLFLFGKKEQGSIDFEGGYLYSSYNMTTTNKAPYTLSGYLVGGRFDLKLMENLVLFQNVRLELHYLYYLMLSYTKGGVTSTTNSGYLAEGGLSFNLLGTIRLFAGGSYENIHLEHPSFAAFDTQFINAKLGLEFLF